jgi:putative ABC transport system permease protein
VKKIAALFVVAAFAFSFYAAFLQTDYEEFEKVKKIEETIGREFVIPNSLLLANPEELYPALHQAAAASKINIMRAGIHYKENNEVEVLKFLLLTTDTNYFRDFPLKSGRYFTMEETWAGHSFLSTARTGEREQIGEIQEFRGNHLISVYPLLRSFDVFPVHGTYYAEVSDERAFQAFIDKLALTLNQQFSEAAFTPEDFLPNTNNMEPQVVSFPWITILESISYGVFVIAVVLLVYYIFHESKRIGILKMHGASNLHLWYLVAGRLITIVFICMAAVTLAAAAFVEHATASFVWTVAVSQLKAYLILLCISLLSYLYIMRINIIDVLKSYKDTKSIFLFNIVVKIGCSTLLILVGGAAWWQLESIQQKKEELKNWEHSKDYGVFYPAHNGLDGERLFGRESQFEVTSRDELYFLLNRMGALFVNAIDYEESSLLVNQNWEGIRSVRVNPNYLKQFPVLDAEGRAVNVPEETTDWVLLVPAKYRDREEEILSYFQESRKRLVEIDRDYYQKAVPDAVLNQNIDIIWLKNEQQIFSFNPKVFPAEHHVIVDPILEVMTEKNSLLADRDTVLGRGPGDPLKIKLIQRDPLLTYQTLEPELKRLQVDDNLKHLITVDEYILQEIYQHESSIKENVLAMLGLAAGLVLLVVQNLLLFFHQNQKLLIVRRLFGTGFFKTYQGYALLFILTWLVQFGASVIANRGMDPKLMITAAILFVVEGVLSVIALMMVEQKNKVRVLKGGS